MTEPWDCTTVIDKETLKVIILGLLEGCEDPFHLTRAEMDSLSKVYQLSVTEQDGTFSIEVKKNIKLETCKACAGRGVVEV